MSDEQEATLENALQRAADHPAERPEFLPDTDGIITVCPGDVHRGSR